jgi:hypothetical protein
MASILQTTRQRPPRSKNPLESGLPDPRPVTDFTVAVTAPGGNTRLTVTLANPCVIRSPRWRLVDCTDGSMQTCPAPTVISNTSFRYDFTGELNPAVGFVDVPNQDTEIQNFQGGFVRPGGKWFRAPAGP